MKFALESPWLLCFLRRIHHRTYYRLSHRWIQWNCVFNHQSRARFNMPQLRFKWLCVVPFRCDFSSFAIPTSMEAHNDNDFLWIPILSGNAFFPESQNAIVHDERELYTAEQIQIRRLSLSDLILSLFISHSTKVAHLFPSHTHTHIPPFTKWRMYWLGYTHFSRYNVIQKPII